MRTAARYDKLEYLWFFLLLGLLTTSGCATTQTSAPCPSQARAASDDRLDAILWQTTSAEYRVLAQSIYATAKLHLEHALADRHWTALPEQKNNFENLPPAVIMDIDETVIDTRGFQSLLVKNGARFSTAAWRDWQKQNQPTAVPGAVDFISFAQSRGVTIFYVTNRDQATEQETRSHLTVNDIKLPEHIDTVLSQNERPDWGFDKGSRRQFIAKSYRVVMVFGDDLGDFVSEYRVSPQARMSEALKYNEWGRKWFMLPNPMYGSWESSLYDFASRLSPEEISRRKFQQLP